MKKFTSLWRLVVVVLLFTLLAPQAPAQLIQMGGTQYTTASYMPIYGYYDYAWSRSIYKHEWFGNEGFEIYKLGWNYTYEYGSTGNKIQNCKIWMKHVTALTWPNTLWFDPAANGYTKVWEGEWDIVPQSWNEKQLQTNFAYNGIDHVAIIYEDRDGSYSNNPYGYAWQGYMYPTYQSQYRYADGSFPTSGYNSYYIPNLRVYYLIPPGTVSGTVTDAQTSDPISGALVTLSKGGNSVYTYTGPDGTYELTNEGGTNNFKVEKPGYATYSQDFYLPPLGTATIDVAMGEDLVPPSGVYAELRNADVLVVDVTWGIPLGLYEIIYDDGEFENLTSWLQEGSFNALKFTPVEYPVTLIRGSINIGDGTYPPGTDPLQPFNVAIFDDDGTNGFPGTQLVNFEVEPLDWGWVGFDLSRFNITLNSGDFYIAMQQGGNYPNCAPIAIDESNPVYRSYSKYQTQQWIPSTFNDFMMRAVCQGPGGGAGTLTARGEWMPIQRQHKDQLFLHQPRISEGYVGEAIYMPLEGGDPPRDLSHYEVWRIPEYTENDPTQWTLLIGYIPSNVTHYTDNQWTTLPDGGYRWGVKAVYTGGTSAAGISNMLGKNMDADITFNVTTSSGESPLGAFLQMNNLDGLQEHQYSAIVPADGIVFFENVWKGTYNISVIKTNYDPWGYTNYVIDGDETFDVYLLEVTDPPENLYVDPLTLLATWDAPTGFLDVFNETWNGGSLAYNGWTLDPATGNNWAYYAYMGNPSPCAWFYWSPSYTNYSQNLVSRVFDGSTLSALTLEYDIYLSNFSTSTLEQCAVEIWDGSAWQMLANYTNSGGSIPWTHTMLDVTEYIAGHDFQLRFRANGEDSYNINYWVIDNIHFYSNYPKGVIGYNVYLDAQVAGFTTQDFFEYNPATINWGQTYISAVDAYYASGFSDKIYYQWTSAWLPPPRNLMGEDQGHIAYLTWEMPVSPWAPVGGGWEELMAANPGVTLYESSDPVSAGPAPIGTREPILIGNNINDIRGINTKAYGYNAYSNGSSDPTGTMTFILSTPGNVTPLGPDMPDFLAADDFANGIWYGTIYGGGLYTIDTTNGAYTYIGGTPDFTGMAWDPTTQVMYACNFNGQLYTVNLTNGASTLVGGGGPVLIDMACTNEGNLYGVDIGTDQFGSINKANGAWTQISYIGFNANYAQGMAIDRELNLIYYAPFNNSAFSGQLYTINHLTGALTFIGNFEGGMEVDGFAIVDFIPLNPPEGLIGFNIYRDGAMIASTDAETLEYYDTGLPAGYYDYEVTAVYGDPTPGESVAEGPYTLYIDGEGTLTGTVSEYGDVFYPISGALITAVNELGTFTAISGTGGLYTISPIREGTYTVTCEAPDFETQVIGNVFVGDQQTTELNFELLEFPYPVIGVTATRNHDHSEVLVDWFEYSNFYQVWYDDGEVDNVTAWQQEGNMNALRFTPLGYPANIFGVDINIYDGTWPPGDVLTPFEVGVYDDNGADGFPGTELGRVTVDPFAFGWVFVDLSALDISLPSGDFYVAMIQGGNFPDCAPIAIDEDAMAFRSYSKNVVAGEPWRNSDFADFMMRAYLYDESKGANIISYNNEVTPVDIKTIANDALSLNKPNMVPGTYTQGDGKFKPVNEGENTRDIEYYGVYLLEQGQEANPDLWILKDDMVEETSYNDIDWDDYDKGWYRYAVQAIYTYNESAFAFSNLLPNGFEHTVTLNVRTNDGSSSEGAYVTLRRTDGDPNFMYEAFVPENGTVIFYKEVWDGFYELTVTKDYYNPYYLNNIAIYNDLTLTINIMEMFLPPACFYVDNMTGVAWWCPPVLEYDEIFSEGFEGGAIPAGWTQMFVTGNEIVWGVGYGGPVGIPAFPHGGEWNATFYGSSGTTRLITPGLELADYVVPKTTFWHTQPSAGPSQDELRIFYRAGVNAPWKLISAYFDDIPVWKQETVTLPTPTDGYSIGFQGVAPDPGGGGVSLDDIKVFGGLLPERDEDARILEGYNVYLNGVQLDFTTELTYTYTDLVIGQFYVAGVQAQYTGGQSIILEFPFTYYTCDYFEPPTDFAGAVNGMNVILTWQPPEGVEPTVEWRYDDGTATAQLGWNGATNPSLGATHYRNAQILGVAWYCTSPDGQPSVQFQILGVTEDGLPNSADVIAVYSGVPNPLDVWNTYMFPAPANAPDGFYVGIGTPNAFTAVGTDDGVGAPWEFIPGTQWTSADWTTGGDWTDIADYGFPYNFTLRAFGYDNGPSTKQFNPGYTHNTGNTSAELIRRTIEPRVTNGPVYENRDFVLKGYNVWRDGERLNAETLSLMTLQYIDVVSPGGIYYYNVTAVYDFGQSCPIDPPYEAIVGADLNPPQNLQAFLLENDDVLLTWSPPGAASGQWVGWDDGIYFGRVGLNGAATWYNAAMWGVEDLVAFDGQYLTKVRIVPSDVEGICDFTLKVWTGEDAANEVASQMLNGLLMQEWNTITLTTPIMIDATEPLYVGLELVQSAAGWPAGRDEFTDADGNGNLLSFDAIAWEPMSNYNIAGDWNIECYVATEASNYAPVVPLVKKVVENHGDLAFESVRTDDPVTVANETTRGLLGYNLWRNGSNFEYVPEPDTFYTDAGLDPGTYEYYVSAVYDEGESFPEGPASVTITGKGHLSGYVYDYKTNSPIEGATVNVPGGYTGTTGFDGRYAINMIPAGTYDITCVAAGYNLKTAYGVDIIHGETTVVDFGMFDESVFSMPFSEPWDEATFDDQNWTFDPTIGNWQIQEADGNPPPSAMFYWSPTVEDYSFALVSPQIDATSAKENVTLAFDLFLSAYSYASTNFMTVEVWDGTAWVEVATFDDSADIPWTTFVYNVTDEALGELIQFRFVASGVNSFDINWWYVDNIHVYESITATLYGMVTELATGDPIQGAMISIEGYNPVYTDAGGMYELTVEEGSYDVECSAECFNPVVIYNLMLEGDVEQNFELTQPILTVDPLSIVMDLPPWGVATEYITITNDGNGVLNWNADVVLLNKEVIKGLKASHRLKTTMPDNTVKEESPYVTHLNKEISRETWDVLFNYDVVAASGAAGNAGAEFDGEYFYTTRWASDLMHQYDADGNLVKEFSVPGVANLRDLAFDGQYLYGGAAGADIFCFDPINEELIDVISTSWQYRAIAYDPELDGFWGNNWSGDIVCSDRATGATIDVIPDIGLAGIYGLAYDNIGGRHLWAFDQGGGAGTPQIIYQIDIASGTLTGVSHDVYSDLPSGIAGGLFVTSSYMPGVVVIGGLMQGDPGNDYIFGYELATYDMWISVGATSGSLAPGQFVEVPVFINPEGQYEPPTVLEAQIYVTEDLGCQEAVVDVTVTIIVGVDDLAKEGLISVYPNPAANYVNLSISDDVKEIRVLNYVGQVMDEMNTVDTKLIQLNTSTYANGTYLIEFKTGAGDIITKSVVITR
jgi:hypothetical protein